MEYYSATKDETLSVAAAWVELEPVMLSHMSEAQKDMASPVWNTEKGSMSWELRVQWWPPEAR